MLERQPILVIEDDEMIRATISDALRLQGYPVFTACNGVEAMKIMTKMVPGLVILDMWMPVMSGWDLLDAFKERDQTNPVLILTADLSVADERREYPGETRFLAKPFAIHELLNTVALLHPDPPLRYVH